MALDTRSRSEIYESLIPVLGERNANTLMDQFPAIEADELVTKQFLRAELAELRIGLEGMRTEMIDRFHRQTVWMIGVVGTAVAVLGGIDLLA